MFHISTTTRDDTFQRVTNPATGPNSANESLMKRINDRRKIHMTPTIVRDSFILRFAVCSRYTTLEDVDFAWREIQLISSGMVP
ncbi:aromatic-L-amino-acid decarboxylase [Trichonephila clavipes]|nr:aromatic-L-amino-acid decarboxylase [Trichonephila clavipes]